MNPKIYPVSFQARIVIDTPHKKNRSFQSFSLVSTQTSQSSKPVSFWGRLWARVMKSKLVVQVKNPS